MIETLSQELHRLQIGRHYRGYTYTLTAVELLREDACMLRSLTKTLLPEVARRHRTKWRNVERNIRTIAQNAWQKQPEELTRIAGYPLAGAPTTGEFLEILFHYVEAEQALWETLAVRAETVKVNI